MPSLPTFVKTGAVLGKQLVVGSDTIGDADVEPDATYPVGSTLTIAPSVPYLLFASSAQRSTVYLDPVVAMINPSGDPVTVDGDPLRLVANVGQPDGNPQGWYWTVTPRVGDRRVLPFRLDVVAGADNYLSDAQPIPASVGNAVVRGPQGDKGDKGAPGAVNRLILRQPRPLHSSTVNPDVVSVAGGGLLAQATQGVLFTTTGASPTLIPDNYAMVDWGQAQKQTPRVYPSGGYGYIYHEEPWRFQQGKTIRFFTDSKYVSVSGYFGVNGYSKVWVDGQQAAANNLIAWGGSNPSVLYLNLTFASNKSRLVEIKTDNYVLGVSVESTATVWAPEPFQGPRILCVGDSLTQGLNATANYGAYQMLDDFLGIPNIAIDGQAGSGYFSPGTYYQAGSGNGAGSYRDPGRLANNIAWNPDVVVIGTPLNDFNSTPQRTVAQVEADMVALFTAYRNALPNAVLITTRAVLSPYFKTAQSASIPALVAQLDADLDGGLLDSLGVKLIPKASGWFTGTGNASAPTGNGNSDRYIGSDGAHPNDAGSHYLCRRLGEPLLKIIDAAAV